jgi:DNA-binding GntR family transcriptional regulator
MLLIGTDYIPEATTAGSAVADALEIPVGSPILLIERTS